MLSKFLALRGLVGGGGSGGGSADEGWFNDGDTHIWIRLSEGRTSPMLGVCPNGTVTVDWGDGTEPDTLTGTSTSTVKWTPTHNYAKPGDYIITLKTDGEIGLAGYSETNQYACLLRHSSGADARNNTYQYSVVKVEIGASVTTIGQYAFRNCYALKSVTIPNSITSIDQYAFGSCYSLESVVVPDSVTSIGVYAFNECKTLASVTIPNSVTTIGSDAFRGCSALKSVTIPNGVTSIGQNTFLGCQALTSIDIPNSVTTIGSNVFQRCQGLRYCDFSTHTAVPTLASADIFTITPSDLEVRVPAALYDEWIAATNWSTYASKIVAV